MSKLLMAGKRANMQRVTKTVLTNTATRIRWFKACPSKQGKVGSKVRSWAMRRLSLVLSYWQQLLSPRATRLLQKTMYRSDGGNVFQLMTATNKEKETEVILAYGIRLKGKKQPFPMMFATEKEAKDYTMMERCYYPPDLEVVKIKVEAI